jgi:hypothetical protein
MQFVGMDRAELGHCLREAPSRILALVPCLGAHFGEKMFHCCVVAGKELPIEETGIPLQQHSTQIEHDHAAACRQRARRHGIASYGHL